MSQIKIYVRLCQGSSGKGIPLHTPPEAPDAVVF
jgi:hypothetical protein